MICPHDFWHGWLKAHVITKLVIDAIPDEMTIGEFEECLRLFLNTIPRKYRGPHWAELGERLRKGDLRDVLLSLLRDVAHGG